MVRTYLNAESLEERGWGLHEYTELAAKLHLISEQTAIQVRQMREFRNLIHSAVTVRTQQQCSRGTALAALAASELVVSDALKVNAWVGLQGATMLGNGAEGDTDPGASRIRP